MSKRNKIIYWVATLWLALGMISTGAVQLTKTKDEVDLMSRIDFPVYFLTIIGAWKLLGVIAILIPKFPLVKEWAYAGFFFSMTGAIFCHLAVGDSGGADYGGPILLVILTIVSWYFRPAERRLVPVNQ
jgi:hypothetical protein